MKAIIIGGGISGPAAAIALQKVGVEATIYEAHEEPAESQGLFLGIGVNGLRVLKQLDLIDPIYDADTIPTPQMVFSSTTGKRLGVVSNGSLEGRYPSPTLMRGTLQAVLAREAKRRGIEIHYGKRFLEGHHDGNGVIARFLEETVNADLLIGADGLHSAVRRVLLSKSPEPTYTGLLNLGGTVPESGFAPTPGEMHMIWGRRAFFGYTVRPSGETWWFANVGTDQEPTRASIANTPDVRWREQLRHIFRDDQPFIRELIHRTDQVVATPIHDIPTLASWYRGRMVLLGDAAHAVSPSTGQGASLALEDALALAKCLRDSKEPDIALANYERMRRPRTERMVAVGRRRGKYKTPKNRLALLVRDLVMPIAFKLFATEEAMSWIYDYRIAWEGGAHLPTTESGSSSVERRLKDTLTPHTGE